MMLNTLALLLLATAPVPDAKLPDPSGDYAVLYAVYGDEVPRVQWTVLVRPIRGGWVVYWHDPQSMDLRYRGTMTRSTGGGFVEWWTAYFPASGESKPQPIQWQVRGRDLVQAGGGIVLKREGR
jgi:hypothetical protein